MNDEMKSMSTIDV
jgi:hypothetical protein